MSDFRQIIKDLTSKDEVTALIAAKTFAESGSNELYEELVIQSEYLFPFIKRNICKRLENAFNESNYKNLIKLFETYSSDYDETFALIISKYADEELTEDFYKILTSGSESAKTYAARYFERIPDTIAAEELGKYIFSQNESLAGACAAALGKMNDEPSYNEALELLKSNDSFESLKAVEFFVSYGKNPPTETLFKALKSSTMSENFAGMIPYLIPPDDLIKSGDIKNALIVINEILTGLGEILPLSDIFVFEMYDISVLLIDLIGTEIEQESRIAAILLKAKIKFEMFTKNDEYTFDEDKNTKEEIRAINNLFNSLDDKFTENLIDLLPKEFSHCRERFSAAAEIAAELQLKNCISSIAEAVYESEDETLICEGVTVLKQLNALNTVNKDDLSHGIKDENLKAVFENCFK